MKWLTFALVLINVVRLRGWLRLMAALRSELPPFHAALGLGDMLIGASALGVAISLVVRPWAPDGLRVARLWSIAAAADLALASAIETLFPTADAGFHNLHGMITLLATNVAAMMCTFLNRSRA